MRGPETPQTTRDDTALCGGCIPTTREPSAAGTEAVLGMSLATAMSIRGEGGGDAHESERYLLSFSGSEISRHLNHVDSEREEAMEGLI